MFLFVATSCLAQLTATQPHGMNAVSLATFSDASAEGARPACGGVDGQMSCTSSGGVPGSQIVFYDFMGSDVNLTASKVYDESGNGNDLTLAASPNNPTFSSYGMQLAFSTWSTLPTGLSAGKSFDFYICQIPNTGYAINTTQITNLISSSDSSGLTLSLGFNADVNQSYFPEIIQVGSWKMMSGTSQVGGPSLSGYGSVSATSSPTGGCHDFIYVTSTTFNQTHLYVDGVEQSYITTGLGHWGYSGDPTLGTMYLGKGLSGCGSCGGGNGFLRTFRAFSTQLTPAQVASLAANDIANAQIQGVPRFRPNNSPVEQITVSGDSRSNVGGVNPPWPTLLSTGTTFNLNNNSEPGRMLYEMSIYDPSNQKMEYSLSASRNTAFLWGCVNDFMNGIGGAGASVSATTCEQSILRWATQTRATGYKVIVFEELSAGLTGNKQAVFDPVKNFLNTWIRANWTSFADAIVACTDPNLCADGAYASTTYFRDTVHPTSYSSTLLGAYASNAYRMLYGSTVESPTTSSALAYQMTAADSYLNANNSSNAVSLALPNCLGFESSVWSITAGSGSYAVTLAPVSGQTIDGSTSAITLTNGQTKKLALTLGAPSTGGCSWVSLN
jgi:hypothetical protein